MIQTSENANPNYLCKVVELKGLKKHCNADRLQTVSIDFQTVITGMDAKNGDIYVYFPLESKISKGFLAYTNSFRDSKNNYDNSQVGFFEDNCRVRAMRLRGEKSMGYIVPISVVAEWAGLFNSDLAGLVGKEFDTVGGQLLVEKYMVNKKVSNQSNKNGKKPKMSRLIDGQVHLHTDTENLRKSVHLIQPQDNVSITYKTHGTSWWVANVLVKRSLTIKDKIARWFGVKVIEQEYDVVYGSRRVVKNEGLKDPKAKDHFFGYDLWEKVKDEVKDLVPKGYTLYGEMLGYNHNGGEIQKDYDYGCDVGEHKLEVYRITRTNPDGLVTEMSHGEIIEFCNRVGLKPSTCFYRGKAIDLFTPEGFENIDGWREQLVKYLEANYNEKDCFMCINKVPEEGIVLRRESLFNFEAYKLKSFRFLEKETKQLDSGVDDIESLS